MPPKPASLKVRALQWLAQREHSRDELKRKLLRLAGPQPDEAPGRDAEVDALLDWLVTHGYLSATRFVESRVHARQQRYGNLRIVQELKQHGMALDAPAREALEGTEFERALAVWAKKFDAAPADAAARMRQLRFLIGRGFSSDVIRRVLREAVSRSPESRRGPDGDPEPDSESEAGA